MYILSYSIIRKDQRWLLCCVLQLFLAYLYGMSLVFILFVEIYLLQMTRKHGHERKKNQEKPQILVKDKVTDAQSVYDTVNGSKYMLMFFGFFLCCFKIHLVYVMLERRTKTKHMLC